MDENTPRPDDGPRVSRDEIRDVSRLRRSSSDRYVAGVAGGLARHLDIDPVIIRVLFVVLTLFGGAGIVVYGALWLLVPDEQTGRAKFDLDERSLGVALVAVMTLGALLVVGDAFSEDRGPGVWFPVPVIVIGVIAWLVLRNRDRRRQWVAPDVPPPPPPGAGGPYAGLGQQLAAEAKSSPEFLADPGAWKVQGDPRTGYRWQRDPRKRGPKLFWYAVPLIALALGTLGAVDLGGAHVIGAAYPALALGIVAALLLLGAFWGRAGGLILLGLLLVPVTAAATAAEHWDGDEVTYRPATAAEIAAHGYSYREDPGRLVVDLSAVRDPEALIGHTIKAGLDVGEVEVVVPEGIPVIIDAHVHGPGGWTVFGEEGGGIDQHYDTDGDPERALTIEADVNVGHIEIGEH